MRLRPTNQAQRRESQRRFKRLDEARKLFNSLPKLEKITKYAYVGAYRIVLQPRTPEQSTPFNELFYAGSLGDALQL